MQRYHYRAQCRNGIDPESYFREALPKLKNRIRDIGVQHLSLFHWGTQLFLYCESAAEYVDPHRLFLDCEAELEDWRGTDITRKWVPMMDIFHYQQPVSEEHWRRSKAAAKPFARIARLKPEQVASYIFYHYQYQEERPGDGDKYGMIALHENLLFFYSESPATIETPPYEGKLSTLGTPSDWAGAMEPHFIMWDDETDGNLIWLEIPLIIQV